MHSRFARGPAIYGPPDTGAGATMTVITGCREPGSWLRLACCGRQDIGDGRADSTSGTGDIGGRTSASTVASTTDSATAALDLSAANGAAEPSSITDPGPMGASPM